MDNHKKNGVDRESPIYQTALAEMRLLSRPVLDFLNDFYEDVKEQSAPERALFEKAKPVSPLKIAVRQNTLFQARVKKTADDELMSIQYQRPNKKLRFFADCAAKKWPFGQPAISFQQSAVSHPSAGN